MDAPLQLVKVDLKAYEADLAREAQIYCTIRLRDLSPGVTIPCDVFFHTLQSEAIRLRCLVKQGGLYEQKLHDHLVKQGVSHLYIRREDEERFFAFLRDRVLGPAGSLPEDKRTELIYDFAERLVRKVFRDRPSRSTITSGKELVGNFAAHLTSNQPSAQAILSLFSRDYQIFSHCVQVALLGMTFGQFLGWSKEEVNDLGLGALFHDIGKGAIEERVLNKPAGLDGEEFNLIKRHPVLGHQQLKETYVMTRAQLEVVLHHHEAFDGSGYPHGIKGSEIHKYARLTRIVDVYDALTSKRVYKEALPMADALRLMTGEMSESFDPHLMEAFVRFLGQEAILLESHQEAGVGFLLGLPIQIETGGGRFKTMLVGMEPSKYLIMRLPRSTSRPIERGSMVIGRYISSGTVYGFRTAVIASIQNPLPLLFLAYPKRIENVNLREHVRIDCFLPAEIQVHEKTYPCVILDLSVGGCRLTLKDSDEKGSLPLDGDIAIRTQLFGEKQMESFSGKVRNVKIEEGSTTVGVRFTDLGSSRETRLDGWIREIIRITGG